MYAADQGISIVALCLRLIIPPLLGIYKREANFITSSRVLLLEFNRTMAYNTKHQISTRNGVSGAFELDYMKNMQEAKAKQV